LFVRGERRADDSKVIRTDRGQTISRQTEDSPERFGLMPPSALTQLGLRGRKSFGLTARGYPQFIRPSSTFRAGLVA
jgi:hypothetical protein